MGRFLTVLLLPLLLTTTHAASEKLDPRFKVDAPIKDFYLPAFRDDGYKSWSLRGKEGHFVKKDVLDVRDITIHTYSKPPKLEIETTITCPRAIILHKQDRAFSKSPIKMTGSNFSLTGNEWYWNRKKNRILIQKKVQVTFNQSIDHMLLSEDTPRKND